MHRIAILLCLALLTAACGGSPGADQDRVLVAATPWPLQWLAEQIAPEAEVRGLGQAGQDPHELDLRPAERELLERADVVLFVGPVGFQPQVEEAAAGRGEAAVAVTEAAAELLLHAAAHEHAPDEHEADEHEADDAVDPHVWFDPRTLAEAAGALAERLAAVDPQGAQGYRERAAAVRARLLALHDELGGVLTGCRQDAALVGHEAFAYLLAPRGLEQVGISGVGGHADVSPARMAELTELIARQGIRAVLAEPVEGREAAEALAREAGVDLAEVDTLEAPEPADRERGYPDLLREQARVFAGALECSA